LGYDVRKFVFECASVGTYFTYVCVCVCSRDCRIFQPYFICTNWVL